MSNYKLLQTHIRSFGSEYSTGDNVRKYGKTFEVLNTMLDRSTFICLPDVAISFRVYKVVKTTLRVADERKDFRLSNKVDDKDIFL